MININTLMTKRLISLYVIGFLLVFGYAFARPCIDSMFLEYYSHDHLPLAWILTSLTSVLVIIIYNKYNQNYAILPLYGYVSLLCAAILLILLSLYFLGFIVSVFLMYIWKEIYMVVLMETYWSYADIVFSMNTAKHTYGLAMAISSLGGVLGNLVVGPTASLIGTKFALCFLLLFLIVGFLISILNRDIADEKPSNKKTSFDIFGFKILFKSKYLVPLGVLACLVQIFVGLIDYQFNGMLRDAYINTDMRTEIIGQIHATVNFISFVIQLSMGPILRIFGMGATFKAIPMLLMGAVILFLFIPQFSIFIAVKIANKTFDYSLFRGIKEMLYIPLSREEKTQGKGLIDIFIYRLARGLSSALLIAMISVGLASFVMELSLILTFFWLLLAIVIIKRYRSLKVDKHETSSN